MRVVVVGDIGELKPGGVERAVEGEAVREGAPGSVEVAQPLLESRGDGERLAHRDEVVPLDRRAELLEERSRVRRER